MNLKNLSTATIAMIAFIFIFSCSGGNMPEEKVTFPSIKDVSASSWEKLAQKKIYFGHQSVGFNIIDGIKDVMKEYPEIKLNIAETYDPEKFQAGTLAHSRIGYNTDPNSKLEAFAFYMKAGGASKADLASFKYCYVDITRETNVKKLFLDYEKVFGFLNDEYPETTFINITVPLKTIQSGLKAWIKKILGKSLGGVEENIKRNNYNEMLIKQYEGKEPIFDIAKIQSTYPDGTRAFFPKDGKTYYSMVPEYTNDGGHLNEVGRKKVAEQFLILLAKLN